MRNMTIALLCCLSLPAQAQQVFEMPNDAAAAGFVESNIIATFYHELGHALIDVLQLPVLGREEDAADTLSALLIHDVFDETDATAIVYDTSAAFVMYDNEAEGYETAYSDTHGLDLQRYYNLVCLFYGASPEVRKDVATELELPEDRAEGCADEYDLAYGSWGGLLEGLEPTKKTKGLKLIVANPDDPIEEILAAVIENLNTTYGLPEEVTVSVSECGEANAFYDPNDKSITICTEYAQDLSRIWLAAE